MHASGGAENKAVLCMQESEYRSTDQLRMLSSFFLSSSGCVQSSHHMHADDPSRAMLRLALQTQAHISAPESCASKPNVTLDNGAADAV